LADVFVVPKYRNNGIGKFLVREALKETYLNSNTNVLYLVSHSKTLEFYKSLGFVINSANKKDQTYILKYNLRKNYIISNFLICVIILGILFIIFQVVIKTIRILY